MPKKRGKEHSHVKEGRKKKERKNKKKELMYVFFPKKWEGGGVIERKKRDRIDELMSDVPVRRCNMI